MGDSFQDSHYKMTC